MFYNVVLLSWKLRNFYWLRKSFLFCYLLNNWAEHHLTKRPLMDTALLNTYQGKRHRCIQPIILIQDGDYLGQARIFLLIYYKVMTAFSLLWMAMKDKPNLTKNIPVVANVVCNKSECCLKWQQIRQEGCQRQYVFSNCVSS